MSNPVGISTFKCLQENCIVNVHSISSCIYCISQEWVILLRSKFSSKGVWRGGLFRFGVSLKPIAIMHKRTRENLLLSISPRSPMGLHDTPQRKKCNTLRSKVHLLKYIIIFPTNYKFFVIHWRLSACRTERINGNSMKPLQKLISDTTVRIKVRKAID